MAAPTNIIFNVLDSPILEQTGFGPDMKNWLSNSVDVINSALTTINSIFSQIIVIDTFNAGGFGSGPVSVPVLGMTPNGFVTARILSTTNPNISIVDITALTNQFQITFNADPGASAIITYQAYSANPQG